MMTFIIVAQLLLDGGLHRVESSVGASSKALLAEIYKELATVRFVIFVLIRKAFGGLVRYWGGNLRAQKEGGSGSIESID